MSDTVETTTVRFSTLPCVVSVDSIEWIEALGDGFSNLHMFSGHTAVVPLPPADVEATIRRSYPDWSLKTVEVGDLWEIEYASNNKLMFRVEEIRCRVAYAVDCFISLRELLRGWNDTGARYRLVERKS